MTTPTETTPPLDPAQVALAKLQELATECNLPPDRLLALLVLAATDDNVTDGAFRCALGLDCCDPLPWRNSKSGNSHRWAYNVVVAMQGEREALDRLRNLDNPPTDPEGK